MLQRNVFSSPYLMNLILIQAQLEYSNTECNHSQVHLVFKRSLRFCKMLSYQVPTRFKPSRVNQKNLLQPQGQILTTLRNLCQSFKDLGKPLFKEGRVLPGYYRCSYLTRENRKKKPNIPLKSAGESNEEVQYQCFLPNDKSSLSVSPPHTHPCSSGLLCSSIPITFTHGFISGYHCKKTTFEAL